MKKLLFILFIFIFASSVSATVEAPSGTIGISAQLGEMATQPPPIAQVLIREGDFAIQLAEALKTGQAKNEAEAEAALASAGIAPKNGWIADYPMTPDIVGELQNAVGTAADSGKLGMKKVEALKAFRTTVVELQLPLIAELPDRYAESPSPTTPQYAEPSVIENYYDTEGPPVVTYYPPPWDYYYLYAWLPSPFWCSGFFFPGFFVLHDFHRVVFVHRHPHVITNHIRDPRTGSIVAIDPTARHDGSILGGKGTPRRTGSNSPEARKGARSIFERSRERVALSPRSTPTTGKGKSPTIDRRMKKQYGMNSQRPSTGETRSLSPSTRAGNQRLGSSGMGSKGFPASRPDGNLGRSFGHGSSHF
jgi:hypothetical protein